VVAVELARLNFEGDRRAVDVEVRGVGVAGFREGVDVVGEPGDQFDVAVDLRAGRVDDPIGLALRGGRLEEGAELLVLDLARRNEVGTLGRLGRAPRRCSVGRYTPPLPETATSSPSSTATGPSVLAASRPYSSTIDSGS